MQFVKKKTSGLDTWSVDDTTATTILKPHANIPKFKDAVIKVRGLEWTGNNIDDILTFMHPSKPLYISNFKAEPIIGVRTSDGFHIVQKGEFIVQYYQLADRLFEYQINFGGLR